jgi:hypothetical protein
VSERQEVATGGVIYPVAKRRGEPAQRANQRRFENQAVEGRLKYVGND